MTSSKPLYPVPQRTATVGMLFFLAALTMLFASSLVGYIVIRFFGPLATQQARLHLPPVLWLSTAVMIASSFTMSRALRAIRAEHHSAFHRQLYYTLALAVTFVAIQTPALISLLRTHLHSSGEGGVRLYGIIFSLILLHAAHVIGGLAGLGVVITKANRGDYDHENAGGVQRAAWYWHFLDIVWLIMFLLMWTTG